MHLSPPSIFVLLRGVHVSYPHDKNVTWDVGDAQIDLQQIAVGQ